MTRHPVSSSRRLVAVLAALLLLPSAAWSWGWGHKFINLWAIQRLPDWQKEYFGQANLDKLPVEYKSIQDTYTGSKSPVWEPYCTPPMRASLHDPGPPEASVVNMAWYLERIREKMHAGEPDEAMKYLGVLCHWNEDPGSPSAHRRYLSESFLQAMIPSPDDLLGRTYTFGFKGIHSFDAASEAALDQAEIYVPRLLGPTPEEAAARMYQGQRRLALRSAQTTIRALVYQTNGEPDKASATVRDQATYNGRHVTDIIYTAGCLASGRFDQGEIDDLATEPLANWLPDTLFTDDNPLYARPYYTRPWLVGHCYDPKRQVMPLAFPGDGDAAKVASGFGVTVPCDLNFTIAPGSVFGRFTARVGLHPSAESTGKAVFVVLVNGEEAARTEPLAGGQPPQELRLELPDLPTVKLTLRTVAVEGAVSEQSLPIWGEPTLWRRIAIQAAAN